MPQVLMNMPDTETDGFVYSGEYRRPLPGELFLESPGVVMQWSDAKDCPRSYPIVRKKWTPPEQLKGKGYRFRNDSHMGVYVLFPGESGWTLLKREDGTMTNYGRLVSDLGFDLENMPHTNLDGIEP